MDTGAYMQNQMDNLIEQGLHEYDLECEQLDKDIEQYIKDNGFTYSVKDIIECYRSHKEGYYISFTAKQSVNHFKDRLQKLFP